MSSEIFTIGHSTLDSETFLRNLQLHGVTAVADVRSTPFSRFNPQYNREKLSKTLADHGIRYVFLGKELGARSDDDSCYVDDKVQFRLLAQTQLFCSGIARVVEGSTSFRIALMCAEKDPLDCHRTILVARELENRGHQIQHIHADGTVEMHQHAMSRLINQLLLQQGDSDLFQCGKTLLEKAYDDQAERIAYRRKA